jgi:Ca-activated chloride channel family protein
VGGSAIIIALDLSGSMCATDVEPNRLTAAQTAVRDFVRAQEEGTSIGLVLFSGFAQVAVAPTTQRAELYTAIDSLTAGRGTAIGAAILKSVDAIAQINPDVAPADAGDAARQDGSPPGPSAAPAPGAPPRSPGSFAPEIVVLLTDGANTRGVTPADAARIAAARGVRVYPIGFGTKNPTELVCTVDQLGGSAFDSFRQWSMGGGGGGAGRRSFLVADDAALREVATITGGAYFSASDADQLEDVLADLPGQVQVQQKDVELSVGLAGVAALLVLLAGWAAARWTAFPS